MHHAHSLDYGPTKLRIGSSFIGEAVSAAVADEVDVVNIPAQIHSKYMPAKLLAVAWPLVQYIAKEPLRGANNWTNSHHMSPNGQ